MSRIVTHGYEENLEQIKIFISAYDADTLSWGANYWKIGWLTLNVHEFSRITTLSHILISQYNWQKTSCAVIFRNKNYYIYYYT